MRDWNGKTEPFQIHEEGWAFIAMVAALVALAIGIVFF